MVLTSSRGRDVQRVARHVFPYTRVIEDTSGDYVVWVATGGFDQQVVEAVNRLPHRFFDLAFKISTGPVVTIRSTKFLRDEQSHESAPLLCEPPRS